jgi:nucleotide-binding universal stress UspA family protein
MNAQAHAHPTPIPGIVVAYDGSPDSDKAARWAAKTAAPSGGAVTALIVMDPVDMPHSHPGPEASWHEIEDEQRV